ncbi:MAG: hypothetical protein RLO12_11635 [Fulvivirga sp.]
MKKMNLEQMANVEGGGWLEGLGCAAGIGLVIGGAGGANIFAFVEGVLVINEYCDKVF